MPVMGEATFTVPLDTLVAAIRCVEPHALRGRKGDEVLQAVRFEAGPELLHVVATNGSTAAVGMVAIDPDSDTRTTRVSEDDGTFVVDIDAAEVRQIVARFTKGASAKRDAPRRTLRMHWTDHLLKLTDVTAQTASLDPGGDVLPEPPARGLDVLVSPPSADYPPVLDDIRRAVAGIGESAEVKPLVGPAATLALFVGPLGAAAGKVDLHVEPTGSGASRGFVVTCGAWFAGTLPSRFNDDDSLARRTRARMTLLHRLLGTPMPDDVDPVDDEDELPVQTDPDEPAAGDDVPDPGGTAPLAAFVEPEAPAVKPARKRAARKAPAPKG